MDPIELKSMIEEAINKKFPWWFYLLIFLLPAIAGFLGSYLRKKGENIATKEDIKDITEKIEKVRSQYSEQLETVKASLQLSNQLKLAALEERLEKHQEAYTFWTELMWSLDDDDKIRTSIENCQNWWNKNCLYLGEDARHAFKVAYLLAGNYRQLTGEYAAEKRKWFNTINEAGEKIVEGVSLPSLGEDEIKRSELNQES